MTKIVIIGTGFIGDQHANAIKNEESLELVAIVDVNEQRAKEMAEKYGVSYYTDAKEMFEKEKVDMIDICLPTFLHEEYVLMAAEYGVHVLCEKPITLTLESMDNMIEATKKAGVCFMVAQVVRFWPEYVEIKKRYDNGDFGDVKMVYAARLSQHPMWTQWHKDPNKGGGGLFDLHLHDIDFLRHIFGEVDTVYAVGWKSENDCWNHINTSLKFKNGLVAVAEGGFDMTEKFPFTMKFRMVGENASIDYDMIAGFNLEDIASSKRMLSYYENGKDPQVIDIDVSEDAYGTELAYFADLIKEGKQSDMVPVEQSRDVVRIMLAIKESLETGNVIKM